MKNYFEIMTKIVDPVLKIFNINPEFDIIVNNKPDQICIKVDKTNIKTLTKEKFLTFKDYLKTISSKFYLEIYNLYDNFEVSVQFGKIAVPLYFRADNQYEASYNENDTEITVYQSRDTYYIKYYSSFDVIGKDFRPNVHKHESLRHYCKLLSYEKLLELLKQYNNEYINKETYLRYLVEAL